MHDYQAVIRLHSILISSLLFSSYSLKDKYEIAKVDETDLKEGTDSLQEERNHMFSGNDGKKEST